MSTVIPNKRRGKICLFWCSATGDDETTVGVENRLDIEVAPVNTATYPHFAEPKNRPSPDNRTKFVECNPPTNRFDTRNPNPFSENTIRPDTGYSGTMVQLDLLFDETDRVISSATEKDYRAKGIALLLNWSRSDNTVRSRFKNGRIGMRNDYRPEYSLKPDNFGGYKVLSFDPVTRTPHPYYTRARLILQYSGAPGLTEDDAADAVPRLGNHDDVREDVV